jgi:hypothetical protein
VNEVRSRVTIVAASVRFPVIALARGSARWPQIGGWGEQDDAPSFVTLRYGSGLDDDQVEVTTYPIEPWDTTEELAQGAYVSLLSVGELRARDELRVTRHDDDRGGGRAADDRFSRAHAEARQTARREVLLPLDEREVSACVLGIRDLWAAAFNESGTDVSHRTVVLTGRNVALEEVALQVSADLPSLLSSGQQ